MLKWGLNKLSFIELFRFFLTGCRFFSTIKNSGCLNTNELKNYKTFKKIYEVHSWRAEITEITVWSK